MPWVQIVAAVVYAVILLDIMLTAARVGKAEILTGPEAALSIAVKTLIGLAVLYLAVQAT